MTCAAEDVSAPAQSEQKHKEVSKKAAHKAAGKKAEKPAVQKKPGQRKQTHASKPTVKKANIMNKHFPSLKKSARNGIIAWAITAATTFANLSLDP